MKRLISLVLIAALGWSGYWFWQAHIARQAVTGWFEDRRADGWQAEYDALRVRGFPNRIDVTLDAPRLSDPDRGVAWQAPFLQVLRLSYRQGHEIVVFPDAQQLTLPSGEWDITSDGLRASVVHEGDGILMRANAEAEVLNLNGPERSLALAGMTAAIAQLGGQPYQYRIGLGANALAGQGTGEGLLVEAIVDFDGPWNIGDGARPRPEEIELRLAQYETEGMALRLTGTLDLDPDGIPEGELTLQAKNWRELLQTAREAGQIDPTLADALEQGLSLVAGLRGNPETLDLPLDFRDDRVFIGPVPVGRAPRLQLP